MEVGPIVLFNIFFVKENEIQPDAGKSLIYRNSLIQFQFDDCRITAPVRFVFDNYI